jgi:hypothetical protein
MAIGLEMSLFPREAAEIPEAPEFFRAPEGFVEGGKKKLAAHARGLLKHDPRHGSNFYG